MSIPLASVSMIQAMRDDKDLRQTDHPMNCLMLLHDMAERDENVQQKHLVACLLEIIDGLHTRICELEAAKAQPVRRQINNPEDEDSE